MGETRDHGWTIGAPKWAAVIVLGAASVGAIGWAMGRGGFSTGARAAPPVVQTVPHADEPVAPAKAIESSPKPSETSAASIRKLINVNTATAAELELLPGVGPALAKRIMDYRAAKGPFKRVEDLDAVKGIGPRTIERIRKLVTVE
jgi:competence protein ComEA